MKTDDLVDLEPPQYLDETGQLLFRTLTRRLHQGDGFAEADLFGIYLMCYLGQKRYGDRDDPSFERIVDEYFPLLKAKRDALEP